MAQNIKTLPRRKFFGNLGKGIAGLLLAAAFPLKFPLLKFPLGDKKTSPREKKIRITEHPMAVKRSKKGLRG